MFQLRLRFVIPCGVLAVLFAACSGGTAPAPASPGQTAQTPMSQTSGARPEAAAQALSGTASILNTLDDRQTIGSTVDPVTGDSNPYGLDVAKVTGGKLTAGDLVVCDFNDSANVQGTGTSIIALHPTVGASPRHIVSSSYLTGCDALAMSPAGPIWAAAFSHNDNPIISASGMVLTPLFQGPWHHPFGQAFVPPVNSISVPAFYVSNAADGSLVRVAIFAGPRFAFTTIAHGFPVNGGAPGSILGPSGLNYQVAGDRLYVVDGTNNALYAIDNISKIEANGFTVNAGGTTFSGKFAADAHVIYRGAPLNGPISSAIFPGGNIVLGNTLDPNGTNLMVEISPSGHLLATKNVDTGAAGALFGMVATGTSASDVKLYFNDDNDNTVKVLQP